MSVAALILVAASGLAQNSDTRERLDTLSRQIEELSARRDSLRQQAGEEGVEAAALSRELVLRAARIRIEEQALGDVVGEIMRLNGAVRIARNDLGTRREKLVDLLAAMQRLSQRPPALVIMRPAESLETVRSALLLSYTLPAIQAEADALRQEMSGLRDLRSDLQEQQSAHQQILASLNVNRTDTLHLLQSRQARQRSLLSEVENESSSIAALVAEVESLEALLARLDSRAASGGVGHMGSLGIPESYPQSSPISEARGNLAFPTLGTITARFGEELDAGNAKGIGITARPGAQVIAPYDGRIVFAGIFRGYGQLLIIAHGEGYHSLLAGMGQLYGEVGQWILAGEPVGIMLAVTQDELNGEENDSRNAATSTEGEAPVLYLELRRNGTPVNPVPWLAATNGKVSG